MPDKTIDELVNEARGRISAMRIAPPTGLESSRAAADEMERAINGLVALLPSQSVEHFYETVAKVEERYRPAYDHEKLGNAKTEGQGDADQVSTGWWLVLSRLGIAVHTKNGTDYQTGDSVIFTMQRGPRKA